MSKPLLAIFLLVPLVAISATAQAGSTITDKSYWPNEAKQSTPIRAGSQTDAYSAFAYDRGTSLLAPAATDGGSAPRYQGGPKGRLMCVSDGVAENHWTSATLVRLNHNRNGYSNGLE